MSNKNENNDKAFLTEVGEFVEKKSEVDEFGKYVEKEMLTELEARALNYGNPGVACSSNGPLRDQTLLVQEVMALTDDELHRRKRRLQHFVKDIFRCEAPVSCKEQRGHLWQAPSASYRLNMSDSNEYVPERILLNSHSSGSLLTSQDNLEKLASVGSVMDNAKYWCQPNKKTLLIVDDTTESVHGSNPVTPEHINLQEPLESLDLEDGSNWEEFVCSQSLRLIKKFGDRFERIAIPVGPLFQADVPKWSEQSSEVSVNGNFNCSKWLGTKVWPIESKNVKVTSRAIGKGRQTFCSCASPGSTNCVRHHIIEKRRLLKSDLGPLFNIWMFDEMGEEFSKSWTSKEQESFDVLAKRQSSRNNFLQNAMKCLPSKSRIDITTYYFNVFMPRLLSLRTRLFLEEVDSDVDDVKNVCTLNMRRCKDRSSRKNVKSRWHEYL